jgi:predicted TIM-barrel fold metal-dependent hydrolase
MRIDAHNHLGGPDKGDGKSQSPDEILAVMDGVGIDKAVVFPFNEIYPGLSFRNANNYIADAMKGHPDRLIGFCRLDPNAGDGAVGELRRCYRDLGLKGIKLHPTSQNFALDHPTLIEILELAGQYRMPVIFDTGKRLSPPGGVAELARKFPALTIIMAHINLIEESLAAAGGAHNIYLGTTGYFNTRRLGQAIKSAGAGRFISGSDSPYIKMAREAEKFSACPGLTDEERRLVLGENFRALMGL